jgi:hypothetical protein
MFVLASRGYRCIAHDRPRTRPLKPAMEWQRHKHVSDDLAGLVDSFVLRMRFTSAIPRASAKLRASSADTAPNASRRLLSSAPSRH